MTSNLVPTGRPKRDRHQQARSRAAVGQLDAGPDPVADGAHDRKPKSGSRSALMRRSTIKALKHALSFSDGNAWPIVFEFEAYDASFRLDPGKDMAPWIAVAD